MSRSPSIKLRMKQERERGMHFVGTHLNDAQCLTIANNNKTIFEHVDQLPAAAFLKTMDNWRGGRPDAYEAFWWWRRSVERAAATASDDEVNNGHHKKGYAFGIVQYLAEPFGDAWNDDRRTLKDGYTPWITEEQIEEGLDHRAIKRYLWAWHNRDVYTEEDEATARPDQPIKAGERKFQHADIVIDVPNGQHTDVIARWFGVPEHRVKVVHGGRSGFLQRAWYTPHESPKAVEQGKTHYDDDEMHASPGFDFRREFNNLEENRRKYGGSAAGMTLADTMRMHVLVDGWSLKEARDNDALTYSKIRSSLPPLRLDYLASQDPCPFRLNIYVDGGSGMGKSSFCEALAQSMFPAYDRPSFVIGNDERVTFDGYDGEPVIIWEEMRSSDFIFRFTRKGTLTLFDTHPKPQSQQVKHGRIVLTNAINIINGIEPYETFLRGLAGEYVDKRGVQHLPEDVTQVYRRMPLILCIHKTDFDVLVNHGFMTDDLSAVNQFHLYRKVTGGIKVAMERLDGPAKVKVIGQLTAPVKDAIADIRAHHDDKISDVDAIPDEFADFGRVKTPEEIEQERLRKQADEQERRQEEQDRWHAERASHLAELAAYRETQEYVDGVRAYDADHKKWSEAVSDFEAKVEEFQRLAKVDDSRLEMSDGMRRRLDELRMAVGKHSGYGRSAKGYANYPEEPAIEDYLTTVGCIEAWRNRHAVA